MKITDVTCFPVYNGQRNNLFVTVDTDEGIYGVGESGLSGRELAVIGAVEHLKPMLIGQDPSRIEHLWQLLFRGGFFPANRVIGSAISAIDIALWDIQGKALGVPIYKLLGGLVRDRVVCYPHNQVPGDAPDVQGLVESCQRTTQEGWKFVRWGLPAEGDVLEPRRAVRLALAQMEAVRNALAVHPIETLRPGDAAVLFSHRGTKRFSINALGGGRQAGLPVILITGEGSGIAEADLILKTVPQERSAAHTISYTTALVRLTQLAIDRAGRRGDAGRIAQSPGRPLGPDPRGPQRNHLDRRLAAL
jgi:hypothetical protein